LIIAFPELFQLELTVKDEFILIGCDGIWETMSNQKIVDFILQRLNEKKTISSILAEFFEEVIAKDTTSKFSSLKYYIRRVWM